MAANTIIAFLKGVIESGQPHFELTLKLADGGELEMTGEYYKTNKCAYHRCGSVLQITSAVIQPIQPRGIFKQVIETLMQQFPYLSFRFEAILDDELLEKIKAIPGVTVQNEFDTSPMIKSKPSTAELVETTGDEFVRHLHEVKYEVMPERSIAFIALSRNLQNVLEQRYLHKYTLLQNLRLQEFVHKVCNRLPREILDQRMLDGLRELIGNKDVLALANALSRMENASD